VRRRRRHRRPRAGGVDVTVPKNLDPTRRSAKVTFDGAPAEVIPGGRSLLVDLARLIFAAEAVGMARVCTEQAAEYAKVRAQFGRVIGTFQAVKHHCANMAVAAEADSHPGRLPRAATSVPTRPRWRRASPSRRPIRAARHRSHIGLRGPIPLSPAASDRRSSVSIVHRAV
jgi:alkylation response protein AidB-like acyl-CoA dehydrogenase